MGATEELESLVEGLELEVARVVFLDMLDQARETEYYIE
jgi:hypothetical protein